MRALVQRVTEAWVASADPRAEDGVSPPPGEPAARIGLGLVALIGVTHHDDEASADRLAAKIAGLRVFTDDQGAMNLACSDVGGAVLVVSQFTLYGDTRKGRRPSFIEAAPPEQAEPLIERCVRAIEATGVAVATGRFRTHMQVGLVNDGPVTVMVEV